MPSRVPAGLQVRTLTLMTCSPRLKDLPACLLDLHDDLQFDLLVDRCVDCLMEYNPGKLLDIARSEPNICI